MLIKAAVSVVKNEYGSIVVNVNIPDGIDPTSVKAKKLVQEAAKAKANNHPEDIVWGGSSVDIECGHINLNGVEIENENEGEALDR